MRPKFSINPLVIGTCLCAVTVTWPMVCRADTSGDALAFVRRVGHDMPTVLSGAHTIDEKRARLLPFIARVVDVNSAARYCLGRYWAHATAGQQQAFSSLFLSVLVNEIAMWTGNYENPGITTSVEMQKPVVQAEQTEVPTIVKVGEAPPAHITWFVNMRGEQPTILDVAAEGISLRATERGDLMGYLSQHGGDVDGLIAVLRQRALATGGIGSLKAAVK